MSWIRTISYEEADKKLQKIYDRISGPDGNIDNVLLIHSLRPHTLSGHMGLYKSVLHHQGNQLDRGYLETLGVYVSQLNNCVYCFEHHLAGLKRLVGEQDASAIAVALESEVKSDHFDEKELAGLIYARQLTLEAGKADPSWLDGMKDAGLDDGEILEINQVVSYFNYVNRVVVGLGVTTEGDILGLSPNASEDPDNWQHK